MLKPIKYILSLPTRNRIIDIGSIVKNAKNVAVIFPLREKDASKYRDVEKLVRPKFTGCKIYAIVTEGITIKDFDEVIYISNKMPVFGRRFFNMKNLLRGLEIDVSFDLNREVDIITYLVGAPLRIGFVNSPFFNVIVSKGDIDGLLLGGYKYASVLG